jgi:hypothetical protein
MKIFCTEIRAIDPHTGEMKTWCGENIEALSFNDAVKWCRENMGYLKVLGELAVEIPCKEGTYEPDFENMIDYEKPQLN